MTILKKLLCVMVLLISSMTANSQTFGVKAGLNVSKMLIEDDAETFSDDFKWKQGFMFGGSFEVPFSDMFLFETGLQFSTKGFKEKEEFSEYGVDYEIKNRVSLYYAEIPLNMKVVFNAGTVKVFGILGPYVGIGLYGKSRQELTIQGDSETDSDDIAWGSDEDSDDLKRMDFGLETGAGVEIKSFLIGVTYQLGLANISAYTADDTKVKNRTIGLAVGYKFNEKE